MFDHIHGAGGDSSGSMQGWGSTYDRLTGTLFLGRERAFREKVLKMAEIRPGMRVLDVGCGTGTSAVLAGAHAGPQGESWGVDVAADMLATAERKARRAGVDARFQLGSAESLPFPDGRFDVVTSSLMLHHLPDDAARRRAFAEMYRVLKPGGRLLIVEFRASPHALMRRLVLGVFGRKMAENDVDALRAMAAEAKFSQIETVRTGYLLISAFRGIKREK